jgi:hypothetical protein
MFTGQGQTRAQEFERLYEMLGKLGKPIMHSRILIEGAMKLSQDLIQGFTVQAIPPLKPRPLPIRPKEETTIKSIVGRMFSSQEEQNGFIERLRYLEEGEITDFIQRVRSAKTRVHPELLLIDHFERNGCNFLNIHEKYIGGSKPACYLCHMYIAQHPSRYVVPACHNKLYIAWRPPDVFVGDTNGTVSAAAQEKIILKMIQTVRKDLVAEINSRTTRRPFRADSTAGITLVDNLQQLLVIGHSGAVEYLDPNYAENPSTEPETNLQEAEIESPDLDDLLGVLLEIKLFLVEGGPMDFSRLSYKKFVNGEPLDEWNNRISAGQKISLERQRIKPLEGDVSQELLRDLVGRIAFVPLDHISTVNIVNQFPPTIIDHLKHRLESYTKQPWDWWPLHPCRAHLPSDRVWLKWECVGHVPALIQRKLLIYV